MGVVAVGGTARGVVAVGGAAIGVFSLGGFSVGLLTAVGGSGDLATAAQATMASLHGAIASHGGAPRIRSLVGTTQPTLQSLRMEDGGIPAFAESLALSSALARSSFRSPMVFSSAISLAALSDSDSER